METDLQQEVYYRVVGEDGIYTFSDTWADLARQIGFLTYCGFQLLGIDGLNGFRVSEVDKKEAK